MTGTGRNDNQEQAERSGCMMPLVALAVLGGLLIFLRFGGSTLAFALLGRPVGLLALVGVVVAVFVFSRRGARRRR